MWQKSRNRWLKEGERNKKVFQHLVIQNRMQNKIFSIKNARGEGVETKEGIETSLNHYFTEIMFESRQDMSDDIDQITWFIPSMVTHDQNDLLMKPITLLEVEVVVF